MAAKAAILRATLAGRSLACLRPPWRRPGTKEKARGLLPVLRGRRVLPLPRPPRPGYSLTRESPSREVEMGLAGCLSQVW